MYLGWLCLLLPVLSSVVSAESSAEDIRVTVTKDKVTRTPELESPSSTKITRKTTSSKSSTSSTSSHKSLTTLNSEDHELLQFVLTLHDGDNLYDIVLQDANNNSMQVRIDFLQPDIWLMNGDEILQCDVYNQWFYDHTSLYSMNLDPPILTAFNNDWELVDCYDYGAFFTSPIITKTQGDSVTTTTSFNSDFPAPTKPGVYNGQPYSINYVNQILADGELFSSNLTFISSNNKVIELPDFTFNLVNDTNVFEGGLGLAGNPYGSGFLDSLKLNEYINSSGYSLFFQNDTRPFGLLLPGSVNTKYLSGDFYEFDLINYTGINDNDNNNFVKLPILQLDDLIIENSKNGNTLSLNSNISSIGVLLDPRSYYTYLPLETLVNLAMQINAVYNYQTDRWIVQCDNVYENQPILQFVFGPLKINIELSAFTSEAYFNGQSLQFNNGEKACFLQFLPSSSSGYFILGSDFIRQIYLAVDNEGDKIALANTNQNLDINLEDFSFSNNPSSFHPRNLTNSKSIDYISSGKIPFATHHKISDPVTWSYSTNTDSTTDIPARFLGAVIESGKILTNGQSDTHSSILPGMASAAKENTTSSKNWGSRLKPTPLNHDHDQTSFLGLLFTILGFIGFVVLL